MLASPRELSTPRGSTAGYSFPRQARLTRPAEYKRVFAGAKRIGDRYFTVLALPNDGPSARLGLAIARRAVPTAVARNRLKRIVRESFRQHRSELAAVDVVILAKPGARDASAAALRRSLDRTWHRLAK